MKKLLPVLGLASCLALFASTGMAQGELGKSKGNKGGGSTQTGGGSSNGGGSRERGGGQGELGKGGSNRGGGTQGGGSGGTSNGGGGGSRDRGNGGELGKGGGNRGGGNQGGGNQGGGNGSLGGGTWNGGGSQGSNGGNAGGPLGRVGRPDSGGQQSGGDLINRRGNQSGRSGNSNYGGTNNAYSRERGGRPLEIGGAPIDLRGGTLQYQVGREDNPSVHYRSGYYQYNSNWNDNWFWYPHYTFSYVNGCTISPWYYYTNLPAYILGSRIVFIDNYSCQWGVGDIYSYRRGGGWDDWGNWDRNSRRSDLDLALDDLVDAWENSDRRALGRIIPRNGRVGIYMDGRYCYSIGADDYYDLMVDNIYGTRTARYEILSVRSSRNDAQVAARHDYIDAWGRRCTVYHHYRFQRDRGDFYITDFLVSNRRTGF